METFDWLKPAPLWQPNGRDLLLPAYMDSFRRPQLLAYRSDNFMDEFFAAAETGNPAAFPIAQQEPLVTATPLKLFQPAHGRFYLVCASLCCIRPGFPDRAVRPADEEQIYFVLRRLQGSVEYGWVVGPAGPEGWKPLAEAETPVWEGEEKLPLTFTKSGDGRQLMFGYLPVAGREAYPAKLPAQPETPVSTEARIMELQGRFSRQLQWIDAAETDDEEETDPALLLSIYMLLDLWEYFKTHLPPVGDALESGDPAGLEAAEAALYTFLEDIPLGGGVTLAGALRQVAQQRAELNELENTDTLPNPFLDETDGTYDYTLKGRDLQVDTLETRVQAALEAGGIAETVEVPKLRPETGETFIVRCVYERPLCGQKRYWVSQPSVEFRLAAFFDPDAPVRPVRIPLPDISMSSLRRFKKGAGFIMPSNLLSKINGIGDGQINLLKPSQQLAEFSLGFMCTFSIPIITLCAFILLLVLVFVLNIVFWWIPFFKICLPVPQVE